MYTDEYNNEVDIEKEQVNYENYNEEDEEEVSFWNSNKGLIIKIIIILICIGILIWLIILLKNVRNNNTKVFDNNMTKFRLSSEKYYFIDGNTSNDKDVLLSEYINNGLLENLKDKKSQVCSVNDSKSNLTKSTDSYVLTINLICPNESGTETYYYSLEDKSCLNCNGKDTYMSPSKKDDDEEIEDEEEEEEIDDIYDSYSCNKWSDWTSTFIDDPMLTSRSRTYVIGEKVVTENKYKYGKWSDWSVNAIIPSSNQEIETKIVDNTTWSDNKETTGYIAASDKIKIISQTTERVTTGSYCPSGYKKESGKCYKIVTKNLTPSELYKYDVINGLCEGKEISVNDEGKYSILYKNCQYKEETAMKYNTDTVTKTIYQELIGTSQTMYRVRTKTLTETAGEVLTTGYILKSELPKGYSIVPNSEKIEYSYKLSNCEK